MEQLLSRGRALLVNGNDDVHPWGTLLGYSFFFYEAQQSGVLPTWNRARRANGGWRDDAHTTDGSDIGIDASGGLYDAGDHNKYFVPFVAAFATLGLGGVMHEDGYRAAGEWDNMARNLKFGADYLMKVINPSAGRFVVQVGDTSTDHSYWGRPEQQTGYRPTKTGKAADILGSGAATLASTSIILSKAGAWQDPAYAAALLARAKEYLAVADVNPSTWTDGAYASSSWTDDVALGYLMVCYADLLNGASASCATALSKYQAARTGAINWDWDSQFFAASALLQLMAPQLTQAFGATPSQVSIAVEYMSGTTSRWQDTSRRCPSYVFDGDFSVCYTPGGMPYLTKWGTLRHALNAGLGVTLQGKAMAQRGNYVAARLNRCWARNLLTYAAGSNPSRQSYIVGYTPAGTKAADRPHHRSASCSPNFNVPCGWDQLNFNGPSPSVLKGALVGGPDNLDNFNNVRSDYIMNEVAIDYNSGFTGALAGTAYVTAKLAAAGCSWTSYCTGGCDAAVDSGQSVSYTPQGSTTGDATGGTTGGGSSSSSGGYSGSGGSGSSSSGGSGNGGGSASTAGGTLGTCKAAPLPSGSYYACDQCTTSAVASELQAVCFTCPIKAYAKGNEWACAGVCGSSALVGGSASVAAVCGDCLSSAPGGACQSCLSSANSLAARLGGADVDDVRTSCFACAKSASDPYACSPCVDKYSTLAAVTKCLACVAGGKAAWQC